MKLIAHWSQPKKMNQSPDINIGIESTSKPEARAVINRAAALGVEKASLSNTTQGLSIGETCKKLGLDTIIPYPEDTLRKHNLNPNAPLVARRCADLATTLAASELVSGNNNLESIKAATLLLTTDYATQAEAREVISSSRSEDNGHGIRKDLDLINSAAGRSVAQGVEAGKLDRLAATCIALVSRDLSLSPIIGLEIAQALALKREPTNPQAKALSPQIQAIYEVAGKLINSQPRGGLKPNDVPFYRFAEIAVRSMARARRLSHPDQQKAELQKFIEPGKIPETIQSLEDVVKICNENPEIRAVSFDMYDTLVQWTSDETERRNQHINRITKIANKSGIKITEDQVRKLMYASWKRRWDDFQAHGNEVPVEQTFDDALNRLSGIVPINTNQRQRLLQDMTREWYKVELETAVVMPGAKEALDKLKRTGKKICLTSNASWSETHIRRVLNRFGLLEYFDAVSISSETGKMKKPWEREFFHYSWRKLGIDPKNILHVGDNPWDDVKGAENAGAKSVHYHNPLAYSRLQSDKMHDQNPQLYAETTVAMEKQALDLTFDRWVNHELDRQHIPVAERERVLKMSKEVYRRSREIFAPVYIGLSEEILTKLQNGQADQVLSLARDGLPLAVTLKLLRHFESDIFDKVSADQIKFVYTSRRILEKVNNPTTPEMQALRDKYLLYLTKKGIITPGKSTILTDLLSGSGETHFNFSKLLPGQRVDGMYLDCHRPIAYGFLQSALHTSGPTLLVDNMLLQFEALLNGPNASVRDFDIRQSPEGPEVQAKIVKKQPTPNVLTRGLSRESILLMNFVATRGILDAVRVHHRTKLAGLPTPPKEQIAKKFTDYILHAPHDDVHRSVPWEDKEGWQLTH